MTKSDILRLAEFEKEHFKCVIDKWLAYWMNQTQNSKEDYDNYFRRAAGVDANMRYHLADLLMKEQASLTAALVYVAATANQLMSSLAEFEGMDESYSSEYFQAMDEALARLEQLKASRGES